MLHETPDVERLIDLPLGCGEGAFWHPGQQALYLSTSWRPPCSATIPPTAP